MDEEEIDLWYDEKKDRLTQDYRAKIDKTKTPDKLKKRYQKEMQNLHKQYESLSEKKITSGLKTFFLKHSINKLKSKLSKPFKELSEKLEFRKKQKPET